MKKIFKLIGTITLAAVIGFTVIKAEAVEITVVEHQNLLVNGRG